MAARTTPFVVWVFLKMDIRRWAVQKSIDYLDSNPNISSYNIDEIDNLNGEYFLFLDGTVHHEWHVTCHATETTPEEGYDTCTSSIKYIVKDAADEVVIEDWLNYQWATEHEQRI